LSGWLKSVFNEFPVGSSKAIIKQSNEMAFGSMTPLVPAQASHKSDFCILSPTITQLWTVASFWLHFWHFIKGVAPRLKRALQ